MIEIIIEEVKMPPLNKRRFKRECINDKWSVIDSKTNQTVYKGHFEEVCIVWHNLNKKHYKNKI